MKKVKIRTAKEIAKDNAKFEALKPNVKRIAIAKDVISSLDLGQFTANRGCYLDIDDDFEWGQSLQDIFIKPNSTCNVCAIGAVFVSKARLCNKANVTNDSEDMVKNLKGIFSEKQLRLMECAFERRNIARCEMHDEKIISMDNEDKAIVFGREHGAENGVEGLMIAIMKNVIKNDGKFKP